MGRYGDREGMREGGREGGRKETKDKKKQGRRQGEKERRSEGRWEVTDPSFSSSIYGPSAGWSKGMKEGARRKEVERKRRKKMPISGQCFLSAGFLK